MKKLPKIALPEKLSWLVKTIGNMKISYHAAHACYFIILAVFPTLVLVLGLLSYTTLNVEDLIELLDGVVPHVLLPFIAKLLNSTYDSSNFALVSLSALTALWSASRGIYGLEEGLDSVYDIRERRSWFRGRGTSLLYTFLFVIVLLLTLVLHVFGNTILAMMPETTNPLLRFLMEVIDLRFFLLLILQTLLFTAMYAFLPSRRNRIRDSIPGALLASLGWLIFSDLFSIYVENFNAYANIYGSVYAVALSMLWLYCCVSIVFYGGALNRFLAGE